MSERNTNRFSIVYGWLKRHLLTRDVLTFVTFLTCTTLVWFIQAQQWNREVRLNFPVSFDSISSQQAFINPLPTTISVKVSDIGGNLKAYTAAELPTLHIDCRQFIVGNRLIISPEDLQQLVRAELQPNTKLLGITPDKIDEVWQKLESKNVTVNPVVDISAAPQHIISEHPTISPSTVLIFGAKEVLDTIASINTEPMEIRLLNTSISKSVNLMLPSNIQCDTKSVKLTATAAPFTEKKFNSKIIIKHLPEGTSIKLFPSTVEVCANVLQKDFSTANPDEITIEFDFAKTMSGEALVPLEVTNAGSTWFNVRINPASADYLIER